MKIFILSFLFTSSLLAQEASQETIEHKVFIPTPFGIKSRTIDKKDAERVLKSIHEFKLARPDAQITGFEILTCTSDYELPQSSVTQKKVDEHWTLAKDRHFMILEEIGKTYQLPIKGEFKICGPEFKKEDLNDRFVTQQSGVIFEERFKALLDTPGYKEQLKEEALMEQPELLKKLYPTPFLAKYKPFQGVRLFIKTLVKEKESLRPKAVTPPSSKSQ